MEKRFIAKEQKEEPRLIRDEKPVQIPGAAVQEGLEIVWVDPDEPENKVENQEVYNFLKINAGVPVENLTRHHTVDAGFGEIFDRRTDIVICSGKLARALLDKLRLVGVDAEAPFRFLIYTSEFGIKASEELKKNYPVVSGVYYQPTKIQDVMKELYNERAPSAKGKKSSLSEESKGATPATKYEGVVCESHYIRPQKNSSSVSRKKPDSSGRSSYSEHGKSNGSFSGCQKRDAPH